MLWILKLIRVYIGGKTEVGIVVSLFAIAIYVLPVWDSFTYEVLKGFLGIVGSLTGVAFLSRVENKEGLLNGAQSLFAAFKKKK